MIGEAHPRLGGDRFVAGTGRFVEDVRVTGLLHAAVLRSPHAHARLVSIDAKRARDLPGVHAVLTAADVPAAAIIPNRVPAPKGTDRYLQPALARAVVRYVGEPVALVVADDPYIARDALDRIDVVYQPLAACASTGEALGAGAARLFAGTDSNNVATITMRVGDADAALAGAQLTLRERFTYPRQTAAALETRGLVAVPPDPRGGELHLIGSTKCIHINRTILAPIFGIPVGALRLTEVDVGGGFGVRGELYPEDILVPLAALKLGRPVKWIESRRENLMAANHAREVAYEIEMGFDRDGRILAMRAVIHADIGAYVRTAALVPAEFGAALLPGPYRVPNYGCDLWSVVTNKTPAGTLRSPGRPECNFVRERLLDQAAARLGIDPAEIRRRNLIRPEDMPYDCGTKSFGVSTVYDSGDFPALFDELLRRLDYTGARSEQVAMNSRPSGPRRGSGLAIYVEKTGLGPFETTQVEATPDGRLLVDTGASSMGPGLETVLAQILGEALGLPPSRFDVRHADTAAVESGVGTYGSRGTVTAGNAAHLAAAKLIAEARQRAAEAWGRAHGDVTYATGGLETRGRGATLADLRSAAGGRRVVRSAEGDLCRLRGRRRRRRRCGDRRRHLAPGRRRRGCRPCREPGAGRRPAGRRRRLRNRQHASREPRLRRGRPAPVVDPDGLRASRGGRHPAGRRFLPGSACDHQPARPARPGRVRQPGARSGHRQRRPRRAGAARVVDHRAPADAGARFLERAVASRCIGALVPVEPGVAAQESANGG